MGEITLYTHERAGAGLTSTDVCRVRGAKRLQVISEGQIWECPTKGHGSAQTENTDISPHAGMAELRLHTDEQVIDLAKCRWAVALVVSGWQRTTIYWISNGLCSDVEPISTALLARGQIEERHCPKEVELPPSIA